MRYVKKREAEAEGAVAPPADVVGAIEENYPALGEHLTATSWPDGEERVTSTLLVFCEAGVWKACLHDRDAGQSLWRTGGTWEGLLESLEMALSGSHGDWRPDKRGKGR